MSQTKQPLNPRAIQILKQTLPTKIALEEYKDALVTYLMFERQISMRKIVECGFPGGKPGIRKFIN